jgi:cytidylate kinase
VVERIHLQVSTDPRGQRIAVDGIAVDRPIRTPEVTAVVSAVSAVPAVRDRMVGLQRELIGAGDIVVEGRDIGTVVAPEAAVKVYLTAASDVRAGRRGAETGVAADRVAADLSRRDRLDSSRATSPLAAAADAVVLDTSELGIADVVTRLAELVAAGRDGGRPETGRPHAASDPVGGPAT